MSIDGELRVEVPEGCHKCETLIKEKLTAMPGVESVQVDLNTNKVTVSFDGNTATFVHVKQALMEEGFAVVEI